MTTLYHWKRGLFSSTYEIYSNNQLIGNLKDKSLCNKSFGSLNKKNIVFHTKGIFKQNTYITDTTNNKIIGNITYGSWGKKAIISLEGKNYYWKYDNAWNTKWSITGPEGNILQNTGKTNKGIIQTSSYDEVLLLSGLFVTNYLLQISVATLVAAMVPIWTVVLNQ